MTDCNSKKIEFTALKNRKITAEFNGGSVTSDAGGLLLREADKKLNLLAPIAKLFPDNRDPSRVDHSILDMFRQRVFAIALGYEDLNDHATLRKDIAIQTMVGKDKDLASSPTLCRFENSSNRSTAWDIHKHLVETFIASYEQPPKELILDFDATDDLVHGNQVGGFYNGYYRNYCFLPLNVFCGNKLLVSYLRPSNKDGARHAWAILALLTKRLRKEWPNVKIIFRGDGGFNRHKMFNWCEKNNVDYIVGIAKNSRLVSFLNSLIDQAKKEFEDTKEKQRLFTNFFYKAGTWSKERTIIGKAEYTEKGSNPRFIVTTLKGDAQELYDKIYCARGDMENRIKETQLDLFSDRTSCHDWWPNQFRLLLSSLAYVLMEYIRRSMLVNTSLENAQMGTIRLRLFKIGAVVIRNTRRIKFMLSSYYPLQDLFTKIVGEIVPP